MGGVDCNKFDFLCVVLFVICISIESHVVLGSDNLYLLSGNASQVDLWGTFRPQTYFGMRAKVPNSLQFGFTWFVASKENDYERLRNYVSSGDDGVTRFSWLAHDGRNYGHEIVEEERNGVRIHFEWIKESDVGIGIRIKGESLSAGSNNVETQMISILPYLFVARDESFVERLSELNEQGKHRKSASNEDSLGFIQQLDDISFQSRDTQTDIHWTGNTKANGPFYASLRQPKSGLLHLTRASRRTKLRKGFGSILSQDLSHSYSVSLSLPLTESWKYEAAIKTILDEVKAVQEKEDNQPEIYDEEVEEAFQTRTGTIPILKEHRDDKATLSIAQRILSVPFELEFVFIPTMTQIDFGSEWLTSRITALTGDKLTEKFMHKKMAFERNFQETYQLDKKGYSLESIQIAQYALANVLGGIGFFHGSTLLSEPLQNSQRAKDDINNLILPNVSLLTATPSRHSFARGFLWDEGFHQLLIASWDPLLSFECLSYWFSSCASTGWIPREQALGDEIRNLFPSHVKQFIMQDPNIANPPTLLLPLRRLAKELQRVNSNKFTQENAYSQFSLVSSRVSCGHFLWKVLSQRLQQILSWFENTQISYSSNGDWNGYRWIGRHTSKVASNGNMPLTFASGLDDYPRALVPNERERHLDLHCWMSWAWNASTDILPCAGEETISASKRAERLVSLLEPLHRPSKNMGDIGSVGNLLCDFDGQGQSVCHEGYVTLYPLALALLPVDSPYVGSILKLIDDDNKLHSGYGLRSLSKNDPFYQRGDGYWTGPIWVPINYLVLASLHEKYMKEGPYMEIAKQLYSTIREQLVSNIVMEYQRTGFFWEQYSDVDGHGQRTRGFSGWSSLILLIMAEDYSGVV
ncbi:Mannosyl-oligosaccharide glucosidase GCS1 [Galdieria sulphuraria]|nr:Mannosyl-oligosaccharide glucosidase GCS1 [Galdieria sulphuraria]